MVRLMLLGTFVLQVDGRTCDLATRKAEALVAYLALRGELFHRRDALAALLWGDVSPSQARHSLRQTIWRIKRALGDASTILITEGETVHLARQQVEVDVMAFERFAASSDPDQLASAAALYKGDLLEGLQVGELRLDNWLAAERGRLHYLAIQVLTTQLQTALAAEQHERAISIASSLLALDATQEHVHRVLMRLYRQQGRPAEALQQYNLCARILQRELGVEPDPVTRQLCQEILIERAKGLSAEPLAPAAIPQRAAAPPVLVLESDPVTRTALERMLRGAGYKPVLRTGSNALASLRDAPYVAVICGLASPFSRTQLLARLRVDNYQGVVLFVTGEAPWPHVGDPEGIRMAYVRRPVRPRALLTALREALADTPHSTNP